MLLNNCYVVLSIHIQSRYFCLFVFLRRPCVAQGDLELAVWLEVTLILPILKACFYFPLCVYMFVCMLHERRCPQRSDKGVGSPGLRQEGGCETPDVGVGNGTLPSGRAAKCS